MGSQRPLIRASRAESGMAQLNVSGRGHDLARRAVGRRVRVEVREHVLVVRVDAPGPLQTGRGRVRGPRDAREPRAVGQVEARDLCWIINARRGLKATTQLSPGSSARPEPSRSSAR